ncbi:MAG: hypothetical protein Solumvirus5_6 [Solumvirus sp.]|uniref:Uncharacterized protein n=1 Tax=Solumvirus sp. TaxID=2487773 RepID=A0A3G5AKF7_9VIRU|nr:MAG: hypothetical protein Solumvirus5_6 [Solumvirus sp.]
MWSLQEIKEYIEKLDVLSTTLEYQDNDIDYNEIRYNILPILIGNNFFGFQIELDILGIDNEEAPKLSPLPNNDKSLVTYIYINKPFIGNSRLHYVGYEINKFIMGQLPYNISNMIEDVCYFGIPNAPIILPKGDEGRYFEKKTGFEIPFRNIGALDGKLYAHGVATRKEHGGLLYIIEYNLGLIKRIITMYQETKKIVLLINIDDYGYSTDIYFNMERSYNDNADTHLYYTFDKHRLLGSAWMYITDNIYLSGNNTGSIFDFRTVRAKSSSFIYPLYLLYAAFNIEYRPYGNSIGNRERGGIDLFGAYIIHIKGYARYYDYNGDLYGPVVENRKLIQWNTETDYNLIPDDFYNELNMIIKDLNIRITHNLTKIVIDYYSGPQFIDFLHEIIELLNDTARGGAEDTSSAAVQPRVDVRKIIDLLK